MAAQRVRDREWKADIMRRHWVSWFISLCIKTAFRYNGQTFGWRLVVKIQIWTNQISKFTTIPTCSTMSSKLRILTIDPKTNGLESFAWTAEVDTQIKLFWKLTQQRNQNFFKRTQKKLSLMYPASLMGQRNHPSHKRENRLGAERIWWTVRFVPLSDSRCQS